MEKLAVGDKVQLLIDGVSHQGMGVGRIDKMVVFVEGALPTEEIEAEITAVKSNMAYARLLRILKPALKRVEPFCAQAAACGGCVLQQAEYQWQLAIKTQMVRDALKRIGHLDIEVPLALGMSEPWAYRNKGLFHVSYENGRVSLGFFAQGSHDLILAEECRLFPNRVNELLKYLQEALTRAGRVNYIQNILIRHSKLNGEMMVVFITREQAWRLPELSRDLMRQFPEIVSVYHNVNTNLKLMLGKSFRLLAGREYLTDHIGACRFKLSPQSFFQINNSQAEALYDLVKEYAELSGTETVLDLYCGIGTIGIYLAHEAKAVYGVESVAQAVRDAKENAALNNLTNCTFTAAKAEEWLGKWQKNNHADVIIVDPPRAGCHQFLLDALGESNCARIVYVSCNPTTLARDAAYLCSCGYTLTKIQPVDMFPHTASIETVCLLSKLNAKQHIEVDIHMDELDLTDAEKKATYSEIKEYVLEHTGLKVSSLYIAQVKQKCGIIERENYNKPKSDDTKQPQCPPDKEKAIKEALKHFGMI